MQINPRIAALFGIAGVVSGFATIWVYSSQSWPVSDIGGVFFLIAFAGALALVRFLKYQSLSLPAWRGVSAAAIVSAGHPVAIWALNLTEVVGDLLCRLTTSPEVCRRHVTTAWNGYLIPALAIFLIAVGTLSIALWLLTGRWENREFILLILGGIGTTWNSLVLTLFLVDFGCPIKLNGHDWTYFLTLALVGEPLLFVISARWIFKQYRPTTA